jgi:hypothetical protein
MRVAACQRRGSSRFVGLCNLAQRWLVAVVADPQFRRDEHVAPVDAGAADALVDLALVAAGGGGVDESV